MLALVFGTVGWAITAPAALIAFGSWPEPSPLSRPVGPVRPRFGGLMALVLIAAGDYAVVSRLGPAGLPMAVVDSAVILTPVLLATLTRATAVGLLAATSLVADLGLALLPDGFR